MKKFLTFVLVLAMVMSVSSFAMAANHTVNTVDAFKELLDNDGIGDVADGDTIILGASLEFNSGNGYDAGSGYVDGVKYTGDKSFTINLGGNTISDDGTINDYLLYFNNQGTKENEITLINGTISGGANLWNVITVGAGASTNATVLNLGNNLTVKGNGSGNGGEDGVVKSRNGSTVNVKSGAKIISDASAMYCIQAATASNDNAYVNIYDGAELVMKMSGGSAVSGTGTVNIYGGTITSAGWGVFTSSTGAPKFTISGGSISGNAGAVASCADFNSDSDAAPEVSITGGTFSGKISVEEYGSSTEGDAKLTVSGGTFSQDVYSEYLDEGFITVTDSNGKFVVVEGVENNGIKLYPATLDFDTKEAGYSGVAAKTVTVEGAGSMPTVTVNSSDYVIGEVQGDDGKYTFTVQPKDGLSAGNHDASLTVTIDQVSPSADLNVGTIEAKFTVTAKPSSGSGISVKYNGGNSFSTSKSDVPTSVEIDGVPVTFNGTGSNFSVGCISSDAKWVTVRWNSTSVTTNFTPDGLVECTTVSIPKTGGMSIWAAIAQFLGF